MNRRIFIGRAAAASAALVAGGQWTACTYGKSRQQREQPFRWAMGWILWRDFKGRDIPLSEAIQTLSELGLDGIEFSPRKGELEKHGFTRERFRDLLQEKKLAVSGNYFGGNFHDRTQTDTIRTAFGNTLENLRFYGARNVIIGPPGRNVENIGEAIRATAPVLNELGRIANGAGIRLGLHPHVNTIVETPDEIDLIMELTDPQQVSLAPDTGHIRLGGGNALDIIRKYRDRLSYFHLKDSAGEFQRPHFGPNLRELGQGEIDFPGIMALLKEAGFSGWLNVEQDYTFTTPAESAAISANYIRHTLKPIVNDK
ncbi:MAG: sugar phosphate isomerase/epimerase [Tannerella sp.]|jgi:inosose dehydratase|nr:sugar phosphate isomerase/epimerase [Tannerella sp.]